MADVPGVQRAAAQRVGGFIGRVPVAGHDAVRAYADLPVLGGFHRAVGVVADLDLVSGDGQADRAGPVAAGRVGGYHRAGLGAAVPFQDLAAGNPLFPLLAGLRRPRGRAAADGGQGGQVVVGPGDDAHGPCRFQVTEVDTPDVLGQRPRRAAGHDDVP